MARIRTTKPSFYRHEGLQDLEIANPGAYCMLVFEGVWGHCDNQGVFEYRPRQLKLDILPFLPFDMATTLNLLVEAGFIEIFEDDGKQYGHIPSLPEHQRFSGDEAGPKGQKHPSPTGTNQPRSTHEALTKQLPSDDERSISQERERSKEEGVREEGREFLTGDGANADTEASEPFRSVSLCLHRVGELLEVPPPTFDQIRRHLPEKSNLRQCLNKHGPEVSAQIYALASKTWPKARVNWGSVWDSEADLVSKLNRPQAGKTGLLAQLEGARRIANA